MMSRTALVLVMLTVVAACRYAGGSASEISPALVAEGTPVPTETPIQPTSPVVTATATRTPAEATASLIPSKAPTFSSQPGCGSSQLPVLGPEEAYPPPFGRLPPPSILGSGQVVSSLQELRDRDFDARLPADVPSHLALQHMNVDSGVNDSITEWRAYYAPSPLREDTTLHDLINSGGFLLVQRRTIGHDGEFVDGQSSRAELVQVGPYIAALIWGDPPAHGVRRSYTLYWSDGTYDFTLKTGFDSAEPAVSVARSMHCSMS